MKFCESDLLREKVKRLIPGGAHTYSKGDDQFPQLSPGFIVRGKGSRVWDPDGNEFLDWGMGLRSVCLGHANEKVLDAVKQALDGGVNFTRPSPIELQLAETLTNLIPCAEMVKFAKNGSDVTTAAVKLARAYTERELVLRCVDQPFFSIDDWFIGDTPMDAGVPRRTKELTINFPYNNIEALEQILQKHPAEIACIIMEPASTHAPLPGYLEKVRLLADQYGIVLIFDEIISGFRWDCRGAQHFYNVTPDLATFGKAMGNGFSVAALTGKRKIMERGGLDHEFQRVFLLSSTNGGEVHSIAAAIATIHILQDEVIINENWTMGEKLQKGFNQIAASHDISQFAKMDGLAISPWYMFQNQAGQVDLSLRTLFLQETIKQGVLIPYISISASHRQTELDRTLEAIDQALRVVAQAIEKKSVEGFLVGSTVKPVFRKFN